MTHARDSVRSLAQPARLVEQLEHVAAAVGLEVRRERLEIGDARAPGGLCRLDGRQVCILAIDLTADEEARALARALLHFDLDAVYVAPAVREYLERVGEGEANERAKK
ncbi:MAG: hypothetical protein HY907_18585 [Deltaproteobacteria bacterium]|nr:hypothetical protein [Deltaproteobacteria bacterium]